MSIPADRVVPSAEGVAATVYLEFWRYFLVSAAALFVDYSLLVGLTELAGLHYLLSGAAGFLAGAVLAYVGSVRWVFARRRLTNPAHELFVFTVIGVGGLGINELVLWVFTDGFSLHYAASKLVAAGAGFGFNFVLRKYVLFR